MMTEKLYYQDSHCFAFEAEITSVEPDAKKPGVVLVTLNRTAFFPEGGGQQADTGSIGSYRVLDVHEKGGRILHTVSLPEGAEAPTVGESYSCTLDAEQRLRRMQNHSGEHVFSGLVHRHYGFDNVGFHMGHAGMQIDFSGEISWEQLLMLEQEANEVVRADLPVITSFPEEEALKAMEYRSKLELTENVRIVEIPGVDRCACCAPHVAHTGEIGLVKVLSAERHKGGVRLELICGMPALEEANAMQKSVTEISNLLSVKRGEVSTAVEKLLGERDSARFRLAGLEKELLLLRAEAIAATDGDILLFLEDGYSDNARREMVNTLMTKCGGIAAVFSGSEETGYKYLMGSLHEDLRQKAKAINAGIGGRGGGRPEMITGSCTGKEAAIRAWFGSAERKGEQA